jgi:exodeoxyribonuclease VII large subunit
MLKSTSMAAQLMLPLAGGRRIMRVSELHAAVQRIFEADFRSIWVEGEISSCRSAPSGHCYFSLKDEQSQVKCALFKNAARFVRFKPRDGIAVLVRGNLEVYEARGEYQLIVEAIEPQGAGALQLAFEQLKKKLAEEGLFDAARKKPLPRFPRRIGIVTSPAGAVIRDILHVLERRFQGLQVRLFPALVQGEGSVEQLAEGLRYFSTSGWAEVVILARGGGSLEDLWSFNEEALARAIAACRVPVISAVGHETDFTIADFVADCRAPTPSAAAEIVIATRDSIREQIQALQSNCVKAMQYRLLFFGRELHRRDAERFAGLLGRALTRRAQHIDDFEFRLRSAASRQIEANRRKLAELSRRLDRTNLRVHFAGLRHRRELVEQRLQAAIGQTLARAVRREESCRLRLEQLSPFSVLARGYAIVQRQNGGVLRSSASVSTGDPLHIRLHEGELRAIVSEVPHEHE